MSFVSTLVKTSFPSSGQGYSSQGKGPARKIDDYKEASYNSQQYKNSKQGSQWNSGHAYNITCKWEPFREQILLQWSRLTSQEVDLVGPNRSKLALLIQSRYGVPAHLVENYLRNFERTLPLL